MKIEISVLVTDELRGDAEVVLERVLSRRLLLAASAAGLELLSGPVVAWARNTDPWSMEMFHWSAIVTAPIAGPVVTTAEVELLCSRGSARRPRGVRMATVPNGEQW